MSFQFLQRLLESKDGWPTQRQRFGAGNAFASLDTCVCLVCMCAQVYAYTHVHMGASVCILWASMYECMSMYTRVCICVCVCVCSVQNMEGNKWWLCDRVCHMSQSQGCKVETLEGKGQTGVRSRKQAAYPMDRVPFPLSISQFLEGRKWLALLVHAGESNLCTTGAQPFPS